MGTQWIRERRARKSGTKKDGQKVERTAVRVFRVLFDNNTDGPTIAEAAVEDLYPVYSDSEPSLVLQSLDTEEVDDSGSVFDVTANYSDKLDLQDQQTDEELHVSFGFATYDEEVYAANDVPTCQKADGTAVDISSGAVPVSDRWHFGKTICNSAGQTFDPSITKTYFDPVITIKRIEDDWDLKRQIQYQDAVNSDPFTISYQGHTWPIDKGQALMSMISAEATYKNGEPKYEATYEIKLRQDGWARKVLDQGTGELNNGDLPCRPIRDAHGDPVTYPVMLDGLGHKLTGSNPQGRFLVFKLHKEAAFGSLNFR